MKPMMILGIVLIIVGAIVLGYHGITYTTHEKVLKIGPIEATKETEKTILCRLSWEVSCLQPG